MNEATNEVGNTKVGIELVTPELAEKMLASSKGNRSISKKRVEQYARMMSEGKWAMVSMVIVDEDGHLMDGHHRLMAVTKANVYVFMIVVRGAKREWMPFIDSGRIRSAADMMAVCESTAGMTSLNEIAAIAGFAIRIGNKDINEIVDRDTMANWIVDNRDAIAGVVSAVKYIRRNHLKFTAGFSYAIMKIKEVSKMSVDAFLDKIATGEMLAKDNPVYQLRKYLIEEGVRRGRGADYRKVNDYVVTIRMWNEYVSGGKCFKIQITGRNQITVNDAYDIKILNG